MTEIAQMGFNGSHVPSEPLCHPGIFYELGFISLSRHATLDQFVYTKYTSYTLNFGSVEIITQVDYIVLDMLICAKIYIYIYEHTILL